MEGNVWLKWKTDICTNNVDVMSRVSEGVCRRERSEVDALVA